MSDPPISIARGILGFVGVEGGVALLFSVGGVDVVVVVEGVLPMAAGALLSGSVTQISSARWERESDGSNGASRWLPISSQRDFEVCLTEVCKVLACHTPMMSRMFRERTAGCAFGVERGPSERVRFPVLLDLWWAKAKRLRSAIVRARE